MGGRGSNSLSGTGAGGSSTASGTATNWGGAPDRRDDIQNLFVDRLGFKEVTGTNRIDTAVLGAYGNALADLEREYGAIAASDSPSFTTFNGTATAAVRYDNMHPERQTMGINAAKMGSMSSYLGTQRESAASGWHARTDGRITSEAAYSITHEYGHMLSNALAARSGVSADVFGVRAQREIGEIARTRYGAAHGSSPSRYGRTNSAEFFAEAFASARLGAPNAYGKAMNDWLETHRL